MAFATNSVHNAPTEHRFNPYTSNGGSTVGVAGRDYAILAGDTRSTSGYSINTRHDPKVWQVGSTEDSPIVLSTVGMAADGKDLRERLDSIANMYKFNHGKQVTLKACAHRLSTLLYSKRFFPYQLQTLLGGLDENGVGAVYNYDPAGSYQRETCRASGVAGSLIEPFLDSAFLKKNQRVLERVQGQEDQASQELVPEPVPLEGAMAIVKDAFGTATERHIEVGDGLQMVIVTAEGVREIITPLKKD